MRLAGSYSRQRKWIIPAAIVGSFAGLGLSINTAMAQSAAPTASEPHHRTATTEKMQAVKRTQGGARVTFSSLKDWNLKGENLSPRGHNPLYFPLKPGFRFIMEHPNHPWGVLRKEIIVLEKTEKFDVPGIGKFECAVVQEEEFFDGVYDQQAHNWFCIDKITNAMYAFGEISWEVDQVGRKVFAGTWRVGEKDGGGMAEPGLLMPGTIALGARYIYDGHEAEAYGYSENLETGVKITVPAGTFENCLRVRENSLTNPSDVTDKWWCKGVGLVKDTSDGELIASDALPNSDMSSFGKFHRNPVKIIEPPVATVDGLGAEAIALEEVPGKVHSIKIERFGRHNVYIVEVIAKADGETRDVFVNIATGKVMRGM